MRNKKRKMFIESGLKAPGHDGLRTTKSKER